MAYQLIKRIGRKQRDTRANIRLAPNGTNGHGRTSYSRILIPAWAVRGLRSQGIRMERDSPLDLYLDDDTLQIAIVFRPSGNQILRLNKKSDSGYIATQRLHDLVPLDTAFSWEVAPPGSGFDIILTPLTEALV